MIEIAKEQQKWSRCQSCYTNEHLIGITVGLDESNACGQSLLILCETCKEELLKKLNNFNI